MQVLVQAICNPGKSLRDAIIKATTDLDSFGLQLTEQKRNDRSHGWAKLRSTDKGKNGAINVSWDANSQVLIARVITRGQGNPSLLIGDFVSFLLAQFPSRIQSISILPR